MSVNLLYPWGKSLDAHRCLVLDASVAINLLASGAFGEILEIIECRSYLTPHVLREIRSDPRDRKRPPHDLMVAIESGQVSLLADLAPESSDVYLKLLERMASGEASAILAARNLGGIVATDDQSALQAIAADTDLPQAIRTVELLSDPRISRHFGRDRLAEIVFGALKFGRMRVFAEYRNEIIDLIGLDRARQCPSLGRVQ